MPSETNSKNIFEGCREEASLFSYSPYWKTWSRVLAHKDGWFLELNLMPIPNCRSSTWENDVKTFRIRKHCTGGYPLAGALPVEKILDMVGGVGSMTTRDLLLGRFLHNIDWALFEEHSNRGAGASYYDVKKV